MAVSSTVLAGRILARMGVSSLLSVRRRAGLCSTLLLIALFVSGSIAEAQVDESGCLPASAHQALTHGKNFLQGLEHAPRNAIRAGNLKWELPIAAATGLLIAKGDQPAANQIQSLSLENTARRWADIGRYSELAVGGAMWVAGCAGHKGTLRNNAVTALTAFAVADVLNGALKVAFNRQYPYKAGSAGEFWEGGRSFPSGHAMTSWAFAAAIAHRYPHKRWVKWGAYALATGISLARYPGKRHYFSDILVGSALGYVTGTYIATH